MPQLESLVMQCLAKDRDARPADARELLDALEKVTPAAPWTQTDAEVWWEQWHLRHPGGVSEYQGSSSTGSTLPSGWSVDALDRLRGSGSRS